MKYEDSEIYKEMRRDQANDDLNLEDTRAFLAIWRSYCHHRVKHPEVVEKIEVMVLEHAHREWGPDVKIAFDRENQKALIFTNEGIHREIGPEDDQQEEYI